MVSFVQETINAAMPHCLLSASQSAALDKIAIEKGVSGESLMEAAGLAAAEILVDYIGTPLEAGGPVIILCGPGNNGGDGFVMARHLEEWGYPVILRCAVTADKLQGDAAKAAQKWQAPIGELSVQGFEKASAVVDCLFGAGLKRPLEAPYVDIIEAANDSETFIFSIDLPSGLNGDTGQPLGACMHADATVTFNTRKPGHIIVPGRFLCGGNENIHCVSLPVPMGVYSSMESLLALNEPSLWGSSYQFNGPQTHKYNRGHMLVLGGREPALGASRLACLAGLRAGAGLVTLAAPAETYTVQAAALMDVMVRRFDSAIGFVGIMADPRISAVLIGPGAGLGEKTIELVQEAGARRKSLVLDADALTSLSGRIDVIKKMKAAATVLTPHEGEFARLFPDLDFHEDRLAAVRSAAEATGAIIVLKGVSTLVGAPDGRVAIAHNAPSWLSVGGTGDVLAGIICGLIAQGMPAFEAACAGVWIHGAAGMKAGRGMIASDMLTCISHVLP